MKIIKYGCLGLILCLAIRIGFLKANKYTNRYNELQKIYSGFNLFKTKLEYTNEIIEEIFKQISKVIFNEKNNIFTQTLENNSAEEFSLKWDKSINSNEFLKTSDKEILKVFGKSLGKLDRKGQTIQIEELLNLLNCQINEAEEDKNKNVKLCKSLGTIIGIGIVIIFI